MSNKRKILIILVVLLIIDFYSVREKEPLSQTDFLLGTIVKISIYDSKVDSEIFTKVFAQIRDIEERMTVKKDIEKSEIIKLNKNAGRGYIELSPDIIYLLEKSKYYSDISRGKFDITIGPLVKLWSIDTQEVSKPTEEKINKARNLVDYRNLLIDEEENKAFLTQSGMEVDLGAIAKGYAADKTIEILKKAGINKAIINIGGNIYALGEKDKSTPWKIGIQDPFRPINNYLAYILVKDKSVVTSGSYEKRVEIDGRVYHHLLEPQTGYPVENNLAAVSIIHPSSTDADALSTTAFLLGLEEGLELIESLSHAEAIFITKDKKIYFTSGAKENFTLLNEEYVLGDYSEFKKR